MGTQFPDIVIGRCIIQPQSQTHIIMFRFVALFALVAVAAAEPQWYAQPWDATHMKTASGDTVSVAAHKAQHHQLKAAEYAKKGYAFGYVKPAVYAAPAVASYAAPVATYAHTYATGMPVYAGIHHLGKREAEADSQKVYNTVVPKVYNTVASPVVYNTGYNGVYNGVYNGLYNTYAGVHSLGKREAEADSQYVYNTYSGFHTLLDTPDTPPHTPTATCGTDISTKNQYLICNMFLLK